MPYDQTQMFKRRNYYNRNTKKTTYKRRKIPKTTRMPPIGMAYKPVYMRGAAPFPNAYNCVNTYLTPVAYSLALSGSQVWRGNSVYDPDQSGTGTTAIGYTALAALYTNYRVYGSSIEISIANTGTSPLVYYVIPCRSSTPLSVVQAKSYPQYKEVVISGATGGPAVRKIKHYCNTSFITNENKTSSNTLSGTGSNPGNQWYWVTGFATLDGTTSTLAVDVKIDYFTEWTGLRPLTA